MPTIRSGLEVFPYRHLHELVRGVAAVDAPAPPSRLPVPLPVVVPSLAFADAWQRAWTDRHGVCMGFSFHMPRDFVRMATALEAAPSSDPEVLTWRIWDLWRQRKLPWSEEAVPPREDWLAAAGLADLFDQYEHDRPEWMAAWAADLPALPPGMDRRWRELEDWQRAVWQAVGERSDGAGSPSLVVQRWEREIRQGSMGDLASPLAARLPAVIVLGAGSLDPLLVRTLRCLAAAGSRVSVHVILASLDYLGELRQVEESISPVIDPEEVRVGVGHPLWQAQGRHAVGAFALLGQLDEQFTHWPEVAPAENREGTLLELLQEDLRRLQAPCQAQKEADGSLAVHACFGPRRELEVLREELRRAFAQIPHLQAEDVCVAVTDWDTYAPLVPAIFTDTDNPLPVRLMETLPGEEAPVVGVWRLLLEAATARALPASVFLELIQNAAVQELWGVNPGSAAADDAVESVRHWLDASGWMKGEESVEKAAVPGSFGAATDRLAAGFWLGDLEWLPDAQDGFLFPVADALPDAAEWVEAWWAWLGELRSVLREWSIPAPPEIWADRLQKTLGTLLYDLEESRALVRPWLAGLRAASGCAEADPATLLVWLHGKSAREGRRTQLTGKITFGRLRQLQHLPCRVLAVVGLGETQFPSRTQRNSWDLRAVQPRLWDRHPRIDDRQLFLDALVTPSDRLILTAPVRNLRSGLLEPFSACVEELLRTLEEMGTSREKIVHQHPLFPFAAEYFRPQSELPASFEQSALAVAQALAHRGSQTTPGWWAEARPDARPEPPGQAHLPLAELARLWKNPDKEFLRRQQLETLREAESDEVLDAPPLEIAGLSLWSIKEAMWEDLAAGRDPGEDWWLARAQANRLLPPAHWGRQTRAQLLPGVQNLWELWQETTGHTATGQWTSADGLTWRAEFPLSTTSGAVVLRSWKKADKPRHFWEAWLLALLTATTGEPRPVLLLQEEAPHRREFPAISTEQAAELLPLLHQGWRQADARPLCYAPEASEVMAGKLPEGEDAAWEAGMAAWLKPDNGHGGGEGASPESRFVWRERDPGDFRAEWLQWAREVAAPLLEWRKRGQKL